MVEFLAAEVPGPPDDGDDVESEVLDANSEAGWAMKITPIRLTKPASCCCLVKVSPGMTKLQR